MKTVGSHQGPGEFARLNSTLGSREIMCIATPISVNALLIDVSYSRATLSLEMLGSEHAIEHREITSRSR